MKLSLKQIRTIITLFILTVAAVTNVSAQCKTVAKDGIKKLSPYTHNGQINNITLEGGKPTEVHLTFYRGLSYKLQIDSEESLGKVAFRVLDENKTEVYNSNTANGADFWTFYSNSSQELIIEVTSADKSKKGCAVVLVGMEVPKTNNSIRNL